MKKLVALVLAMILAISTFGCTNGGEDSKTETSKTETSKAETSKSESSEDGGETEEFSYPVPPNADGSRPTISINMDAFVRADIPEYTIVDGKSYYYFDVLEEATGVHLDMIGSASNPQNTSEAVNLLIVSGEYPDVWRVNWPGHPGGPNGAIADGLILPLNDYTEYCPNLFAFFEENPDLKKAYATDEGILYAFYWIQGSEGLGSSGLGAGFRTDWLADAGLDLPETVDDWTEALRAFKAMGKGGLSFEARWLWLEHSAANLSNAWNTVYGFYVNDGVVQYGPLDKGYGEFIGQLAAWYEEGLLDPDFATVDKATVKAKWANHEYGAVLLHTKDIENGINANKDGDTPLECDTVPPMVMNAGDTAQFGHFNGKGGGAFAHAVSPGENQELAMRWCDYLYSEEGRKLTSLGTEGITYEADENDNWVKFTDLIMNNTTTEDNASNILFQFAWKTNWAHPQIPLVHTYFNSEFTNKANADFSNHNMDNHFYPTVTHTMEEADVVANTYSDIETYVKESVLKFVLGTTPMSEWDAFTEQVRNLGIDEVLEVKQAAYDRYKNR